MRRLFIILFAALVVGACQKEKDVTVNVVVKDKKYEGVSFYLSKMDTTLQLSADGKGMVILPVEEPQYALVGYKWKNQVVYLEPGKDFTVIWDMSPAALTVSFEGDGAEKNNFICGGELQTPVMGDFGLQENVFVPKMDQYVADNIKVLESKGYDKAFEEKEKQRIRYNVYGILWQYARGRECAPEYYEKMKSLIVEEDWLLQLNSYTNFIQGAVEVLANQGVNMQEAPAKSVVMNSLNYTLANIKNQAVKEHLVGIYSINYIDKEGIEEAGSVKKIFDETVTDPTMKAVFDKIYNEGSFITKGKKAHGFKYLDIDGKEVDLADLKGRYVYIDIWATWCAPCRDELPHLQKLEKMFEGTNICFVSISTDKDKAKWEETVKKEKLGGIQLHNGGDKAFMDAFRVKGIPHFILIDTEGNILEANMTRPSDSKTIEYLSMYAE